MSYFPSAFLVFFGFLSLGIGVLYRKRCLKLSYSLQLYSNMTDTFKPFSFAYFTQINFKVMLSDKASWACSWTILKCLASVASLWSGTSGALRFVLKKGKVSPTLTRIRGVSMQNLQMCRTKTLQSKLNPLWKTSITGLCSCSIHSMNFSKTVFGFWVGNFRPSL